MINKMQEEIRDIVRQLWEVIGAHPQSLKLRRATLQLEKLIATDGYCEVKIDGETKKIPLLAKRDEVTK